MKNIFLVTLSTLVGIFLGYICFFIFYYFNFENKVANTISSQEKFVVINKYNKILNHIRPEYSEYSELIFSTISEFKSGDNILMQGDSWFMQINYPANDQAKSYKDVNIIYPTDNDLGSLKYIQEWSKSKNIGVINAGTGSYSPSLMSVQLEVLEKDFGIKPNILIAYIDQTDLGDENCRYKDNKVFKNNELIKVDATETITKQAFDYTRMLKISEINLSSKPKIIKLFKIVNYELQFEFTKFFKKNYFKITNIIKGGWSNRKIKKCNIGEILSYLTKSDQNEINYFKSSLEEYLIRAKNKEYIKEIYLVSFPHLKNLKNIIGKEKNNYMNISDVIDEVLEKNKFKQKFVHINFSEIIRNNKNLFGYKDYIFDNIHLKQRQHKLFIKEIFNQVR
tara:strand:+ start:4683 stop:5864 length:1182 start_codon:yes stop_codon:yes gene_type:complete